MFKKGFLGICVVLLLKKDYYSKGIRAAASGGAGVVAGLSFQYFWTSVLGWWYLEGAILGAFLGFVVNFNTAIVLRVVKID